MILVAVTTLLVALLIAGQGLAQNDLTDEELLGEFLYFDENLSDPDGQSCASCHLPKAGFVDPNKGLPVSRGVITSRFGTRNSPMSAYAMYAPKFDDKEEIGGQFWDGRATGDELGDPLADQALGPFVNPVEMNNVLENGDPDKASVVADALAGEYRDLFIQECGDGSDVEDAYDCIAESIAAFERTELFGQFNSKYDAYLQACLDLGGDKDDCALGQGTEAEMAGADVLTRKEWAGFQLFMNDVNDNNGILEEGEGAACVACHVAEWIDPDDYGSLEVVWPDWSPDDLVPPVFTDFTYDNLGVPKSTHRLLRNEPDDLGLGAILNDTAANGKFKVMTLRNIQLTKPYAHNGFFKSLKDITHFYNTRDVGKWPPPEVDQNVNRTELGNLGLSTADEAALVAFMKTLTDR
jgi:cytochrome c peroxidase